MISPRGRRVGSLNRWKTHHLATASACGALKRPRTPAFQPKTPGGGVRASPLGARDTERAMSQENVELLYRA